MLFGFEGAGRPLEGEKARPVGQEVKTGASHAPNVGSIPARVTKVKEACCLEISTISSVGRAPDS